MMICKLRFGLFEDPYVDPDVAERVVGQPAHRALALEAALDAITLLKNENDLLPLDPAARSTIAVIGPNADRTLLGGYSGVPPYTVSVLQGIRARAGSHTVIHSQGCTIPLSDPRNIN